MGFVEPLPLPFRKLWNLEIIKAIKLKNIEVGILKYYKKLGNIKYIIFWNLKTIK